MSRVARVGALASAAVTACLLLARVAGASSPWSTAAASVTRPVPRDGGTVAFPKIPGFAGTLTVPQSDAPRGSAVRLSVTRARPPDVPAAIADVLVRGHARARTTWLRAELTRDVRFGFGTVAYRFALPDVLATTDEFSIVACDLARCERPFVYGPMRRDGASLAFSTQGSPFHFEFSGLSGHTYVAAIYRSRERKVR